MNEKSKDGIWFKPIFRPSHVVVLLDEGVEEMKGSTKRLTIKDIQYETDYMRIIVKDYRH